MTRPRATSICAEPGCPNVHPCPTHKREPWVGSTRNQRLPTNWDSIRARILRRDGHRCRQCGARATEVDHVEAGDNHHPSNLQALCQPCHLAKTLAEAEAGRKR